MNIGKYTGLTDVGKKRRHNEDSYIVNPPLFAVADGMGGANAGEVASGIVVEALRERGESVSTEDQLVSLIQEANRRVFRRATEDAAASGMGTTIVAALVEDGDVKFGHVGDSRAYLYRDGELIQVTEDHSLVGELVRSGKLSPEDAERHPQRSVITRALGTEPDVDVDTYEIQTRSGDLFILCSDGLYSMVGSQRILQLIERNRGDLEKMAKQLINAANRGGGDDNITVVAFEIAAPGEETVRLPAARPAAEAEPEEEEELEEDTLDEADQVPAVSTMVLKAEDLARLRGEVDAKEEAPTPTTAAAPAAEAAEPTTVADEEEEDIFAEAEEAESRRRLLVVIAVAVLAVIAALVILWVVGILGAGLVA